MRTTALILVTIWLTGTAIMAFVATQNFKTVDRILETPTAQAAPILAAQQHDALRTLLRHLASELNRFYFLAWNSTQMLLAAAVLALVWRGGTRAETGLSVAMMLIAIVLLGATFRIIEAGRVIDFVPRNPPPPEVAAFGRLHAVYGALELLKLPIGCVLGWKLFPGKM